MKILVFFGSCLLVISAFAQTPAPAPTTAKVPAVTQAAVAPVVTLASKDKLKTLVIRSQQLRIEYTEKNAEIVKEIGEAQSDALKELNLDPKEWMIQLDASGDVKVVSTHPGHLATSEPAEKGYGK